MESFLKWLSENANWIFSGVGVTALVGLFAWLPKRDTPLKQSQKSGNNSTNIQAGGNVEINKKDMG